MPALTIARKSISGAFQNWRLWLIQFVGNPLLFLLFAGWLLIPVANALYIILNALVAILLIAGIATLHGGTLNYFSDKDTSLHASLKNMFLRALRNVIPILVCAATIYLLWMLVDKFDDLQETVPTYFRSTLSASTRKHISLPALENTFAVIAFALRWILVPGLILPFAAASSNNGFRGLAVGGFRRMRNAIGSFSYWLVLALAAVVGVYATETILDATPNFATSTYHHEMFSLVIRLVISYALALIASMVTCSAVGRTAWRAVFTITQIPREPGT
jgi:hypothetical protein